LVILLYDPREHMILINIIICSACKCINKHQIFKIGNLSSLPFFSKLKFFEQLSSIWICNNPLIWINCLYELYYIFLFFFWMYIEKIRFRRIEEHLNACVLQIEASRQHHFNVFQKKIFFLNFFNESALQSTKPKFFSIRSFSS